MKIIEARNINYNVSNKTIFHNLSLDIELGSVVCLIGNNSSGKTTLLKLLSGQIISDSNIKIDDIKVNKFNIEDIYKKISIITSYNEYFSKTVMEEILQEKRNVNIFDENKVRKLLDSFNLLYLEKLPVQDLSYAENQIVALIKVVIKKPKIIILDNAFSKLDKDKREELIKYLIDYAKKNKITILFSTNNIEDIKYSDRVLLLKFKNIFFDGTYKDLINSVDLYKEGFKVPFELDISDKLMLYNLIDKKKDNIDEIIGDLCK